MIGLTLSQDLGDGGETSDDSHITIFLLEAKVPENGSKDFSDFWHEVWGP
jgi:hypothetical protein